MLTDTNESPVEVGVGGRGAVTRFPTRFSDAGAVVVDVVVAGSDAAPTSDILSTFVGPSTGERVT